MTCLKMDHSRRLACLILNNLSIPFENKRAMVGDDALLNALLEVMRPPLPPETYLACICLMNLSFLEESHQKLMHYCPSPPDLAVENPLSLLRTMENMMKTYVPLLVETKEQQQVSVEGEAVRWGTGLIRNLVAEQHSHHHAQLVSSTKLPYYMLLCLRESPKPLSQWKTDSLEDLALLVLLNLAKWPESCQQLQNLQAQSYLRHIDGKGGIHDMRASWIRCSLESL